MELFAYSCITLSIFLSIIYFGLLEDRYDLKKTKRILELLCANQSVSHCADEYTAVWWYIFVENFIIKVCD
jgi:hypothetical protein